MLTRRSFLLSTSASMLAGSLRPTLALAAGFKVPLGIQLYTVRPATKNDLEGTLRKVYAAGFREIEFAGYYDKTATELAALMHSIGFTLVSTHVSAGDIMASGPQIISDARALGLKYIVCSSPLALGDKDKLGYGQKMEALDLSDWRANAELFNKFGAQAKATGLQFAYHNHHVEFKKFGDKLGYDELMANSDPNLVKIQLDVGWVVAAGQDPVAMLNQYQGRVMALHVKDIGNINPGTPNRTETVAVGEGTIDWKKVIGTAHAQGVEHYFYEQEPPYKRPVLESMQTSADYLIKLVI